MNLLFIYLLFYLSGTVLACILYSFNDYKVHYVRKCRRIDSKI